MSDETLISLSCLHFLEISDWFVGLCLVLADLSGLFNMVFIIGFLKRILLS